MKKTIQPRLGTVVTMIVAILFLFLIFSQAGKYHKSGYIVEKAEERLALKEERKKAMLQIGVNDNIAIKVNPIKIPLNITKPKTVANNIIINNKNTNSVKFKQNSNKKTLTKNKSITQSIYTVKRGETLFGIAQKVYGDGNKWRKILKHNLKLKNPNQLRSGMKLSIPEPIEGNTAYLKWKKINRS